MTQAGKHAHRLDISPVAGRVIVERDGVTLADSSQALVLREGSLPPRFYLPEQDVRAGALTPTDTKTHCPFKGDASYWAAEVAGETIADLAWSYPAPIEGAREIAGRICFFNEKVDITVDGEPLTRPTTQWS